MVSIKNYKNLRKLARLRNRVQAISLRAHDGERERAPGTGFKRQASSTKPQAPSDSNVKQQASSPKLQASSAKPQASSSKILEPRNI